MRSAIKVEPATAVVDVVPKERETSRDVWGPAALEQRRERTRDHLAKIAARRESWINRNKYYYELLNRLFRFLVEPEKKVLSVRCGTGNPWGLSGQVMAKALRSTRRSWISRSNEIHHLNSRSLFQTSRSSNRYSSQTKHSITFFSTI